MSKLPSLDRAVEEWIGARPDTPVPDRVKVRVFERAEGRCYLSGVKIRPGDPWEVEHVISIINGGENRESNLRPALKAPHKVKTAADLKVKSKIARVRKKHLGIKAASPWPKLKGRGFDKSRSRKLNGEVTPRERT